MCTALSRCFLRHTARCRSTSCSARLGSRSHTTRPTRGPRCKYSCRCPPVHRCTCRGPSRTSCTHPCSRSPSTDQHRRRSSHRSSSPCRQLRHSHSCQTRGSRRRRSRGGCTAWPRLRGRHCCSRCRSSNHCSCTSLCQRHRPSRRRCPCTGWRLRRGTLARSSRCSSQDCTCSFRCPSHHRSKCRGWRTPGPDCPSGTRRCSRSSRTRCCTCTRPCRCSSPVQSTPRCCCSCPS
mmetsp:Transcript_7936/g.15389  ORF Transcript_7936/g.15389 Transcript_7936/m.15389 type:complete len:235 (+) Transcript_7936:1648-2352(+)